MSKICTNLEQSKRLQSLGIDINTADMYWDLTNQNHMPIIGKYCDEYGGIQFPAWSLAALLGVLPNKLQIALAINDFQGDRKEKYAIGSVEHDRYDCYADNPIDACYELILKLHEQNLL